MKEGFRRSRHAAGAAQPPRRGPADRRKLPVDESADGTVDFRFYSRGSPGQWGGWVQATRMVSRASQADVARLLGRGSPDLPHPDLAHRTQPSRPRVIFTVPHAGFFPPAGTCAGTRARRARRIGRRLCWSAAVASDADEVFTLTDCRLDGTLRVQERWSPAVSPLRDPR